MRQAFTTISTVVLVVLTGLLAIAGVGWIGLSSAADNIYTAPTVQVDPATLLGERRHDPAKPTVAIALSAAGTNVADSLAPYEVFARTGGFNVYLVAADHDPKVLTGGLDVLPHHTFDELDTVVGGGPDVIVIPQIKYASEVIDDPVTDWVRQQAASNDALLMGVCIGPEVLAAAGLLDDRPATAHWLKLIGLRRSNPEVDWLGGVRFLEDGNVITTGGVLSGVDGAVRVVERLIGADAATEVARGLHWEGYAPGSDVEIPASRPAPADLVAPLSAAYRWDRPRTGVLLTDGVGEIELSSAFRPYTELSYLSDMVAVTGDGEPIRSRHGLVFVPRGTVADVGSSLDRVVVPGLEAARARAGDAVAGSADTEVTYLHEQDAFPYDGVLVDIARTRDVGTARWVAKSLQYPMVELGTADYSSWPWTLTARALAAGLLGAGAAVAVIVLVRRARAR